jgi:hypothetical protein
MLTRLTSHGENRIVITTVSGDKTSSDISQIQSPARHPPVETTGIRQKSGGNIGGFGGFLLSPIYGLATSGKNTAEVGVSRQLRNPTAGA